MPLTSFIRLILVAGGIGAGCMHPVWGLSGQTLEEAARHWAFQPVRRPEVPAVREAARVQTPVDAFVLKRLEGEGRTFAPPAERRTLLRRVYYDLIGLPPSYAEVDAFEGDDQPGALARVVDRLLEDPRYGERWGRHWLDVARYADTKDLVLLYGRDALRPFAYTYRDYVIRAFNEDLPYDEFVRDQLAADLVEPRLPAWRLAALGLLTLGRLFDTNPHDQIDDQIDTVSRGLLGLTVACARCHDHKYDAVSMEDYYGWYGVFASTERPYDLPLIENPSDVPGGREFEHKLAAARGELEDHIDSQFDFLTAAFRDRLGDYLVRAATTAPDFSETSQFFLSLTPEDYRPTLMLRTRRFLEKRVRAGDRVFGLWAALKDLPAEEFPERAAAVIQETRSTPAAASGLNGLVNAAFDGAAPSGLAEVARRYGQVLFQVNHAMDGRECGEEAYLRTTDERELLEVVRGPDGPVWFPRRDTPLHMSRPAKDRYGGLVLNLDKIAAHASNPPPARAMVVADLPEPYDARVFIRGSPSRPGPPVPKAFLRVLSGGEVLDLGPGSGRLEMARLIASTSNPLTARVWVNRVWMHHFGEPLVSSPADFGARSEAPTHPELLDWLAAEFMANGWRLKPLHRLILLSGAYQQSSAAAGSGTWDPENRWLGHYPRRRLDLEAMRDTLLHVAGRLDGAMGGRPVDVAGDPLNRRRTVYGIVDRQNLPGLYRSFDFAVPDQCVERRPRTTVPQQALFAMNSPMVMEQAKALAASASDSDRGGDGRDEGRVAWLFRSILGRQPTASETERALRFVGGSAGAEVVEPGPLTAWEQLAQVLLISNEAIFLD